MNGHILMSSSIFRSHRANTIGILLNYDEYLLDILIDSKGKTRSLDDNIFFNHLCAQDQLLVQTAHDIYEYSGNLIFSKCLEHWDSESWIKFISAISYYLEIDGDLVDAITKRSSF